MPYTVHYCFDKCYMGFYARLHLIGKIAKFENHVSTSFPWYS